MDVVGNCSICGGEVMSYRVWHGIIPPPVICSRCGAHAAQNGPIIPMTPAPPQPLNWATTTSDIKIGSQGG